MVSSLSLLRHITCANRNVLESVIGQKFPFSCDHSSEDWLNEVVPQLGIEKSLSLRDLWQLVFHVMQRRGGRGPGKVYV